MRTKVLIVDDEESIRFTFSEFLTEEGCSVEAVESLHACFEMLQQRHFDALFLDVNLGQDNGIDAIEKIKQLQPSCSIVIMTGVLNPSNITEARRLGAIDYLVKPIRRSSLVYVAKKALSH